MHFLLDECIHEALFKALKALKEPVSYGPIEFGTGAEDSTLLYGCVENGWVFVSWDYHIQKMCKNVAHTNKPGCLRSFIETSTIRRLSHMARDVLNRWLEIRSRADNTKAPYMYVINKHGTFQKMY